MALPEEQGFAWRSGLRFADTDLETAFWQQLLDRRRRTVLVSVALIVMFLLATSAAVWLSANGVELALDSGTKAGQPDASRQYAGIITLLVAAGLVLTVLEIRLLQGCSWRELTGFACVVIGLLGVGYAALLAGHTADDIPFFTYAFLHVIVLASVFTVVPVRWLLLLSPGLCVIFGVMLFTHAPAVPRAELSFHLQQVASICALTLYVAYTLEKGARQTFLFERQLRAEHIHRERSQSQRLEWISFIAQFLRHEFRNALLGVTSSLELLKRRAGPDQSLEPVDLALEHAAGIRRSLDQAANASALEIQLLKAEPEAVDVRALLRDLVPVYKDLDGLLRVDAKTGREMTARVDADSLHQALSLLLERVATLRAPPPDIDAGLAREAGGVTVRLRCADVSTEMARELVARAVEEGVPADAAGFQLFLVRRIVQALDGQLVVAGAPELSGIEISMGLPEG